MKNKLKYSFLLLACFAFSVMNAETTMKDYYKIEKVNIPTGIVLEVGGLAFNDKGELGVVTRRGELWLIENPTSSTPKYTRYAHGLHEPLGLAFRNGSFYCNQRGELTKLTDKDGDNIADDYETITVWELNGNYHEYSYGPVFLPNGDMIVTLNLGWIGRGESGSKWRGWMMKVTEDGQVTPYATGLRSPAGFNVNAAGDIFYTENQGDWVGSGRMTHLELGDFAGNPEGLKWTGEKGSPLDVKFEDIDDTKELTLYEYKAEIDAIKPPSVWFPHTLMGISTSDIAFFGKNFGPFEGQMMVGDQGHSKIMRVYQEQVNGVYQGVCFPFVEGFSSGILRMHWSPDQDALYAGMTSRGWASTGKDPFGLERLVWTGKSPFEIKTVEAQPNGFKLTFTEAVDKGIAANPASYQITDFTYLYHHYYGSPVQEKENRAISNVEISEDGLSAILTIDKFRKGFIYEIKAMGIKNSKGKSLVHDVGYYTLNEIPEGGTIASNATTNANKESAETASLGLRVNELPESWKGEIDKDLTIGTLPGMKYDLDIFSVRVGSKVKLTLNNNDDMPHNLVIVNPNKADEVGTAAMKLGLDGESLNYIPQSDEIVAHTNLVPPTALESIYFVAPDTPGDYQFVCTFPGHHTVMRGVMRVVERLDQ